MGVELDELGQFFRAVPGICEWQIYADNARPETISYMGGQGFNIMAAPKWAGSVEDGITYIKGFKKVVIHKRCKNVVYEFKNYKYKIDKNTAEILPIVVDKDNHTIDAIRYALSPYIKREVSIFEAI